MKKSTGRNVLYTTPCHNKTIWTIERVDKQLFLFIGEEKSIGDIIEIVIKALNNSELKNDDQFWDIKLSEEDKENVNPITLIYYLTGGDSVWKTRKTDIWKEDWTICCEIFREWFYDKVKKLIKSCSKLSDLKHKILHGPIKMEDFYDFGIKMNIINIEN